MSDKEKIKRLAAYFKSKKKRERAADAFFEACDYEEAALRYHECAMSARRSEQYRDAHRCYIKAAHAYLRMKEHHLSDKMEDHAGSLEQYFVGKMQADSTREIGDGVLQVAEGVQQVAGSVTQLGVDIRDGMLNAAELRARASLEGTRVLSDAIRSSISGAAERIFAGLKDLSQAYKEVGRHMVASMTEGFERLATAQKEAALQQAQTILQGFEYLADAAKGNAILRAYATLKGSENISEAEREVAQSVASLGPAMREGAQSMFRGLSNIAEAEQLGHVLKAKVMNEASKRQHEAIIALVNQMKEGAFLQQKTSLKLGRWQRAWAEGHIFSRGVGQGLKDIVTVRLWRKGIANTIEDVANSIKEK